MDQEITIIGNVGREPEMRYLPDGTAVTNFSVAVNKKYKKDGVPVEETAWFRISTFGKLAETCNQFIEPGTLVKVRGELKFDVSTGGPMLFQRRDKTVGASFEITADKVRFLNKPRPAEEKHQPIPAIVTDSSGVPIHPSLVNKQANGVVSQPALVDVPQPVTYGDEILW